MNVDTAIAVAKAGTAGVTIAGATSGVTIAGATFGVTITGVMIADATDADAPQIRAASCRLCDSTEPRSSASAATGASCCRERGDGHFLSYQYTCAQRCPRRLANITVQ